MVRKIVIILGLFFCLLLIYTGLRVGFYNMYFRDHATDAPIPGMFLLGVQMDFSSLFYVNLVFLLYYFFVHHLLPIAVQTKVAWVFFLLLNIPFLAINFIDLGYYAFTGRRSNADLLYVLPDSLSSLPAFLKGFWFLFLSFAIIVILLAIVAKKILNKQKVITGKAVRWHYLLALPVLLVLFIIARGIQSRPIMPPTPLLYFDAEYQPLVNNSSITFLYSLGKFQQRFEPKNYYPKEVLDSLYPIRRQYLHEQPFQRRNVVIFLLESFCKGYLENGHVYRAHTPFLDSLIAQSTWCSNSFANGVISVQGIVSVLGSMPSFISEPYYHSIYSNNKFRGLGTILKEEGYSTHFFMGASPDHFGFGKWCKIIGIDHYYSQKDFNNDQFYDGNWGIYDHKFLPFGGKVLNQQQNPFLAVFFTISSHTPYTIPPDLRERFNYPGQYAFVKSASYVDYSLRLFFDSIKNTSWFKNTIFVFSADHSITSPRKRKFKPYESFRIPIFIYDPVHPVYRRIDKPVQQADIVPTIFDHLSYSRPFMSFGRSMYDTATNYVTYQYSGLTEILDSSFLLGYNDVTGQPAHLYDIRHDTALKNNLLNLPDYSDIQARLLKYNKAVIQRYNNSLINNELLVK